MPFSLKKIVPYFIAVATFTLFSVIYFKPILKGEKIFQSDIVQYIGSSKELKDHRKEFQEETYWTNATFGGMPTYVMGAQYPQNYISIIDKAFRFLPRPADYLFLYFIGFFVLLMVLKIEWKLAILGSIGFGLSTYLVIILGVGHNAKAHAIAYMPLVLSGILLVFQKKYLLGFIVTSLFLSLEIMTGHIQMTYYLLFFVIIFGIVTLVDAFKKKELPHFFKSTGILLVAAVLSVGINATSLLATSQYSSQSTRGEGTLTIHPNGSPKKVTEGLEKSYITEYSYSKLETFNLFIPRFMGGTRYETIENSEVQKFLQDAIDKGLNPDEANYLMQLTSMYWGEQPIVAAPAYIGAGFIFLFVFALFLLKKNNLKYWLLASTIFSILLSWGHHLSWLTNFFIDYVPLYNKFRSVSSIQVIAEICIPLLGLIGLHQLTNTNISWLEKIKALKNASLTVGGLALIFVLGGTGLFSFETPLDLEINEQLRGYADAVSYDRKKLFFNDSLRSLIIVLLIAGLIFLYLKEKINKTILTIVIGLVIIFDLVGIARVYVNDENFVAAAVMEKPFSASEIDQKIQTDKSYYRVADLTKNLVADASTSYFHKSLGGYHAAKPRRFQELHDFHLSKGNPESFNMLNTKYLISLDEKGEKKLDTNFDANGNAWFVNKIRFLDNENEEILALHEINTKKEAVMVRNPSKKISSLKEIYPLDTTATIQLVAYKANHLTYKIKTTENQFVVFSEIYYKHGWNAYVNGVFQPHYRVNYLLRGMEIPAGKNKIEFKFEPKIINIGSNITVFSYVLFILIPLVWFGVQRKKRIKVKK